MAIALAIATFAGHFRVLLQFFLSYAANVADPTACRLLVITSSPNETAALWSLFRAHEAGLPRNQQRFKVSVLPMLTVVDLPHAVLRLDGVASSTSLPVAKNRGRLGKLYVCTKKAYAARYAHEVLGAVRVLVTDSEAYVWKRVSIASLFEASASRREVWYADAPALAPGPGRQDDKAPIEIKWCSLHLFRDARGLTVGALQKRVPSLTASLFEDMGFWYEREAFREYWSAVRAAWGSGRGFYDAVVQAHNAQRGCIDVGFWLEVSWLLFLFNRHGTRYTFRNATAAIEAALGGDFVSRDAYVHARLELLWRALSNATLPGFLRLYRTHPLPFFRSEFRGAQRSCLPLMLVRALAAPAASLQVNSAVPNWVWTKCREHLPRPLPWVLHRVAS